MAADTTTAEATALVSGATTSLTNGNHTPSSSSTSTSPSVPQQHEQQQQPRPAPREKKRSYTVEEKLAIVQAAKSESLRAVAKRYNVDRTCIRAWRDKEAQLNELHPSARRLPGAGRRPSSADRSASAQSTTAASKHLALDTLCDATRDIASENVKTDRMGMDMDDAAMSSPSDATQTSSNAFPDSTLAVDTTIATTTTAAATTEVSLLPVVTDASDVAPPVAAVNDFLLIGFQGKEGAFSDVAARAAFNELRAHNALTPREFETVGYAQMRHVMDAIERGEVAFGVLPVENSISGTFHGNLDRLIGSHLKIVGEIACVQELCLCALPGAKLDDVRSVLSHPAVLDHCEDYVCDVERKIGLIVDRQATWDSAGACQIVKHENNGSVAAIASEQAAAAHGLAVLEKGIGNELNNETRYMILGRLDAMPLPLGAHAATASVRRKSSIVIAVPNEAQALFKIVAAFALRNLMIIKIESRPAATAGSLFTSETHHWDYIFYVDFIASLDEAVNERLRSNLEEFALWIKDLGTYASSIAKAHVEPPRWKNICSVISC